MIVVFLINVLDLIQPLMIQWRSHGKSWVGAPPQMVAQNFTSVWQSASVAVKYRLDRVNIKARKYCMGASGGLTKMHTAGSSRKHLCYLPVKRGSTTVITIPPHSKVYLTKFTSYCISTVVLYISKDGIKLLNYNVDNWS